jgi:hypothetical protein
MRLYLMAVLGFTGVWLLLAAGAAAIDHAVGSVGQTSTVQLPSGDGEGIQQ